MCKFRPLKYPDRSQLADFLYLAIHVPPGASQPDRAILNDPTMACYFESWGRADDFGIVANTSQIEFAGIAWIRQMTRNRPGHGFIDETTPSLAVAVVPSLRGIGIGTNLLNRLLETMPCEKVGLSVQNSNPAKRLYQRLGFVSFRENEAESVMLWERTKGSNFNQSANQR